MRSTFSLLKRSRSDFLPIIAVLAAGLTLAICAMLAMRAYYANLEKQQFQRNATYYSTNFKASVDRHVASLAAIHAFVSATHDVTRWEFSAFAHQILPQNSGFKAVVWLPYVTQAERKAFEARLQGDGLYGLRLRELAPSGSLISAIDRPTYLPVAYVEPFEDSGSLIGVDLSKNPIYAPLFDAARKTGRAAASPPLAHALVEGTRQPIALVVFPLNRGAIIGGHDLPSGPEGFALGILELDRVIRDSIGTDAPIQAAIAYGPHSAPTVFGSDERQPSMSLAQWRENAAYQQLVPFNVAGQHYTLVLRSGLHGDALTRLYVPLGTALLILALTALLAQSMLTTALQKQKVEQAVIERTVQLHDLNRSLNAEIEQRRRAEAALRLAKDKAENANRAKSAFLATMSHELRTPLNAIIGFSSILINSAPQFDARSSDYHREINGSGTRLLDLINDILEITQMDTEDSCESDPICLHDIIESVIERTRLQAEEAGVSIECSISDPLPVLCGDARRVQKALRNLLSNAVKFTRRGGWARITASATVDGLVLEVIDNGAGMPPGAEARVIDIFSQCDTSLARTHEGVGLGLRFVSRVADRHGATLRISSKLGEGTRVSLTFPARNVEQAWKVA